MRSLWISIGIAIPWLMERIGYAITVVPNLAFGFIIATHAVYILNPPDYYLAEYHGDASAARWVSVFAIGIFAFLARSYTIWLKRRFTLWNA